MDMTLVKRCMVNFAKQDAALANCSFNSKQCLISYTLLMRLSTSFTYKSVLFGNEMFKKRLANNVTVRIFYISFITALYIM